MGVARSPRHRRRAYDAEGELHDTDGERASLKRAVAAVRLLPRESDRENLCFVGVGPMVGVCDVGVGPLEWDCGFCVGNQRSCAPVSSELERPILVGV